MSDDRSGFDPRFDPAFQRGYDGPTMVPPTVEARTPAPARGIVEPEREQHREPEPAIPAAAPIEDEALEEEQGRRLNPFLVALGVVSIVLIIGGIYLISRVDALFTEVSSDVSYATIQALVNGPPIAIALGIATGIGVLFIYAVRWKRTP
jgi:hypothetical protein